MSSRYGVHFWDYYSVVRSRDIVSSLMSKSMRYNLNQRISHPSWYFLVWADVLVAALQKTFRDCATAASSHSLDQMASHRPTSINLDGLTRPLLHTPLFGTSLYCSGRLPSPLNMDAKTLVVATRGVVQVGQYGNYSASPTSSWVIREERPGKYGWISHHNDSSVTSNSLLFSSSHRPSDIYNATELSKLQSARNVTLLVQLQYLKTYTNAGLVELYVCDKKVGSIDALWADEHMRVSVSESFAASVAVDLSSVIQHPWFASSTSTWPLNRRLQAMRTCTSGDIKSSD